MANRDIQRISSRFSILFRWMAIATPLLTLLYWVFFNHLPEGMQPLTPYPTATIVWQTATLAFLISLLPGSVAIAGLLTLTRLFRLYEKAIYFTHENVRLFRRLGILLMLWVVANLLYTTLLSVVMTINNSAGERMVVASFDYSDLAILLIGAVVILISWIMEEGRKLEEEQAHTV